jgi:hypothetical protein
VLEGGSAYVEGRRVAEPVIAGSSRRHITVSMSIVTAALTTLTLLDGGEQDGIMKGLWLALLAGKKFIVIGMLALGAFITQLFGRDRQDS